MRFLGFFAAVVLAVFLPGCVTAETTADQKACFGRLEGRWDGKILTPTENVWRGGVDRSFQVFPADGKDNPLMGFGNSHFPLWKVSPVVEFLGPCELKISFVEPGSDGYRVEIFFDGRILRGYYNIPGFYPHRLDNFQKRG